MLLLVLLLAVLQRESRAAGGSRLSGHGSAETSCRCRCSRSRSACCWAFLCQHSSRLLGCFQLCDGQKRGPAIRRCRRAPHKQQAVACLHAQAGQQPCPAGGGGGHDDSKQDVQDAVHVWLLTTAACRQKNQAEAVARRVWRVPCHWRLTSCMHAAAPQRRAPSGPLGRSAAAPAAQLQGATVREAGQLGCHASCSAGGMQKRRRLGAEQAGEGAEQAAGTPVQAHDDVRQCP